MNDKPTKKEQGRDSSLSRRIGVLESRKLRARRLGNPNIWLGFGTFGMIGWSVAIPTVAGAMLGLWLDRHYPSVHSWTLALLAAGLVVGCWNAWHWMDMEDKAMKKEQEDGDE